MKTKGLGKGLSALLSEGHNSVYNQGDAHKSAIIEIDILDFEPNKYQPRKSFCEESIKELADSIKKHGIIQPIIARKNLATSKYEIIAGERRLRAAREAGIEKIPTIIKNANDTEIAEQALIENIQRENLNPIEEAEAYKDLIDQFGYSQEILAKHVGKTRSHIANMARLANLPEEVKQFIKENKLSFGHAKVIASRPKVVELAKAIIEKGLNVRQSEILSKNFGENNIIKKQKQTLSEDFTGLIDSLSSRLGVKLSIKPNGPKGKITINYENYEELDGIIEILSNSAKR